ncbi:hypothetical protein BD413DRAFT_480787 [Trametes elegans]|nr:hypothetical protein BD413DRAFT_480787 [Trametes elegans]
MPPTPSTYIQSSPVSDVSIPPITPSSPYGGGLPFGTPYIKQGSSSPLSQMGLTITPNFVYNPQQERDDAPNKVLNLAFAQGHPLGGELVPQVDYKPNTQSDRRRYVEQVTLEDPIMFWMQGGVLGIPLRDAIDSRFMRLVDRDDAMFEGRGPSVSIRLNWPGYLHYTRQIPTRDFRSPPHPITRAKLAKSVAKVIDRFIHKSEGQPLEDPGQARWRVGGAHGIGLEDLVLIGLQHVSMGSWQAHLRVIRRH